MRLTQTHYEIIKFVIVGGINTFKLLYCIFITSKVIKC